MASLAWVAAPACAVTGPGSGEGPQVIDRCASSRDCPGEADCVRHLCVNSTAPSVPLLFEVIPPAGTQGIAGISFTEVVDYREGASSETLLTLGFVSRITSSVRFEDIETERCLPRSDVPSDGSPAEATLRMTLLPTKRQLGLPDAARVIERQGLDQPLSFDVAPGEYDAYVEPLGYDGTCARPPLFFPGLTIPTGDVELPIRLGAPELLDVFVRFPGPQDVLNGFALDALEASSGRTISSRTLLGEAFAEENQVEYRARLALAPLPSAVRGKVLLRLQPPKDFVAPTLYVPLAAAELLESRGAIINQLTKLPPSVRYSGRVVLAGTLAGQEAVLSFRAQMLDSISQGTLATFDRHIESDEEGAFEVDLLPGTYEVQVEPRDVELARSTARFVVTATSDVQVGKTVEVSKRREVKGRLLSPMGNSLAGALVDPSAEPSLAASGIGYAPWLGRGESVAAALPSSADEQGRFSVFADPGTFNLIGRSTAEGLPWVLRLSVLVGDGDVVLGDLRAKVPVRVRGKVSSDDLGTEIPFALVRAYGFVGPAGTLTSERNDALYVLPIGESRADDVGRFDLYLPDEVVPTPTP